MPQQKYDPVTWMFRHRFVRYRGKSLESVSLLFGSPKPVKLKSESFHT